MIGSIEREPPGVLLPDPSIVWKVASASGLDGVWGSWRSVRFQLGSIYGVWISLGMERRHPEEWRAAIEAEDASGSLIPAGSFSIQQARWSATPLEAIEALLSALALYQARGGSRGMVFDLIVRPELSRLCQLWAFVQEGSAYEDQL